jgi:hypothetical protein
MDRPNMITSKTIEMVLETLKTESISWPYRFYRGSPVVGSIEIDDGKWEEHVTMGEHCIHFFNSGGPFDEAFVRMRVDAVAAMWKQDINVFSGKFDVPVESRLRAEFPGSDDDLGIHECGVCFEQTSIMTNCLIDGRLNSHSICAGCMAKLDGQCPHKHEEFKGGCMGCMCCSDEWVD